MTESITIRQQKINYCSQPNLFKTAARDKWEPETFDALIRFVMPGKVFIDVGAWVGIFSVYAAKMGAKVYAAEPDPVAFSELIENIGVNENSENVSCSKIAIADKDGTAMLNTNAHFGNSESSLVVRPQWAGDKLVITRTLGSFVDEMNIDPKEICLVKIDCEGSEILLLPGAKDFLAQHKPTMVVAFHPGWFSSFLENVNTIVNTIFPIYDVYSVATKQICFAEEFINAMRTTYDHTFILTAKK